MGAKPIEGWQNYRSWLLDAEIAAIIKNLAVEMARARMTLELPDLGQKIGQMLDQFYMFCSHIEPQEAKNYLIDVNKLINPKDAPETYRTIKEYISKVYLKHENVS